MPTKKTKKKIQKTAPAKSVNNVFLRYLKQQNPVILLVAVVILAIFGYFLFQKFEASQEKSDLLAKQGQLEMVADNISNLHKPYQRTSPKSCSYSNVKFSDGVLSCDVGVVLKYPEMAVEDANKIKNDISTNLGLTLKESGYPDSGNMDFEISSNPNRKSSFSSYLSGELRDCFISLNYPSTETGKGTLSVNLSCTKSPAKAEYFPTEK